LNFVCAWERPDEEAHLESKSIPQLDHEVVLKVDFDLLRDDGCAWVSTRFHRGLPIPEPGEVVYLMDGEGRGCVGLVLERDGWYVCVRPDWSTWTGGDLPAKASAGTLQGRAALRGIRGPAQPGL
jgi:hypothetical protein